MTVSAMRWDDSGALLLLDQRALPQKETWLRLENWGQVRDAIRDMAVRGAPAIGIAAAYGMALAARNNSDRAAADKGLRESRPTAVNLFWALDRMAAIEPWTFESAIAAAKVIELEDMQMNLAIGENGMKLIPPGARVLTICNTGALATGGHGTALGVIRSLFYEGHDVFVYSCETRPRQQGLRLTAYELMKEEIPFQSIADGAAGALMASGKVDCVLVGADRIAANGDTANKIGTYSLAVLAKYHGIPFYVAAPSSTLDRPLASGADIPIEERSPEEMTHIEGNAIAPQGCPVWNPAFDVTPGELISAIITEDGVFERPYAF
jgi:methylthioribose-1-phosphate isomerase